MSLSPPRVAVFAVPCIGRRGRFGPPVAALLSLLLLAGAGCRPVATPRPPAPSPAPPTEVRRQGQQEAARRCAQRRDALLAGLAELRRAERDLAAERAALPPPAAAPPVWDEAREQRYRPEDRELDRERHERDLAAWRQGEAERLASWRERQAGRETRAQERLDRLSRALHRRAPALFTGPTSIEVKPQELARLNRCPAVPG